MTRIASLLFTSVALVLSLLSFSCKNAIVESTNAPLHLPPTVVTDSASFLPPAGAILRGRVNPNGQSVTGNFEYGFGSEYGFQTSPKDIAQGVGEVVIIDTIRSILPDTAYHCCLVGKSMEEVFPGTDFIFRTYVAPLPAVTTGRATQVKGTSATLQGLVNPRNLLTGYHFEYGSTTSYGFRTPTGYVDASTRDFALSEAISSLLPETNYHYRLLAYNTNGIATGLDCLFRTTLPQIDYTVYDEYSYGGPRPTSDTTLFFHTTSKSQFESLFFYIYDERTIVHTVPPEDLLNKKAVAIVKWGNEYDSLFVWEVTLAGQVLTVKYTNTVMRTNMTWTAAIPIIIVENEEYTTIRFFENGIFVKELTR